MMQALLDVLLLAVLVLSEDDVEVHIKQGTLRGHRLVTTKGRDFLAFQGIPYAKPPIGDLRFKGSQPGDDWEGVRDATKEGADCIQQDYYLKAVKGKEDCLFINVYKPQVKVDSPLPVMVWIHGGDWLAGSGTSRYYGGNYLLDKDIVYVTFNYRIGPLGFFSTGDDECPGNNGLKDQVLALQWVRDNIAEFAGDPRRVTLFGHSVGGISAHLHTLSPLSKGLFHAVIAQSGVALTPWAFASSGVALNLARNLSTLLNCPTRTSAEMVACLKLKDAADIVTNAEIREWNVHPVVIFRPVKESGSDAFLTEAPRTLLKDGASVANVPFMAGIPSAEGGIFAATIFNNPQTLQEFSDDFDTLAPLCLMYRETSPDPGDVTRRTKEHYFNNKPITNASLQAVIDMFSDSMIIFALTESVRLQASAVSAPVYLYYFNYKPPVSYSSFLDKSGRDYGVCHSDDLQFFFPHDFLFPDNKLTSKEDLKMMDIMVTLWTNFARTGNPTPADDQQARWSPVTTSQLEYLHFGRDGHVTMNQGLLEQRMLFWTTLPLTSHSHTSKDEL